MSDDFDFEPVRGLPENLPAGEHILWQGAPRWQSLAIDAYHCKRLALYFAVLLVWRLSHGLVGDETVASVLLATGGLAALAAGAVGLLALLAWASARATVYTLTNRRVVLRHGIAVPMTVNIPFTVLEAGAVKHARDGTGDLALKLQRKVRIGYLLNWPHVRRWHFAQPQPALRSIPAPNKVAGLLATALAQTADIQVTAPGSLVSGSAPEPGLQPTTQVAA